MGRPWGRTEDRLMEEEALKVCPGRWSSEGLIAGMVEPLTAMARLEEEKEQHDESSTASCQRGQQCGKAQRVAGDRSQGWRTQ